MEAKTAQLRVKNPNTISAYGSGVFWETPTRAKFLMDTGQFVLVNAPGPTQRQVAGPSETKPMEPTEQKSLSGSAGGPSTDFPASIESGADAQSQFSEAGQVSQESRPILSVKRGPGRPRKEV